MASPNTPLLPLPVELDNHAWRFSIRPIYLSPLLSGELPPPRLASQSIQRLENIPSARHAPGSPWGSIPQVHRNVRARQPNFTRGTQRGNIA